MPLTNTQMAENKYIKQLVLLLVLLATITASYLWEQFYKIPHTQSGGGPQIKSNEPIDPFEKIEIEARAAYVFDMVTGEAIFSYNEDETLPLASLTKVMTAIVASDLIPQSTVVTINKSDIAEEGDSGLLVGEKWRLSDIIDFTLTTSSNDGASAIASVAGSLGQNAYGMSAEKAKYDFVEKMNSKTTEVGLLSTHFVNETGLDVIDGSSGAYGTAKDVALLMAYAVEHRLNIFEATSLDRFSVSSLSNITHTATNTNKVVGGIPGLIASKTGYTELAGGNLVIAFDAGLAHPMVISVLGSSIDGRFEDVKKLVWASLESFSR